MSDQLDGSSASFSGPMSGQGVSNPKLRKRTKTGCLTCRKRRIKCGEERPSCNNCFKSKRHCEGYNQRVIFKTPIGDWPGAHHDSPVGTLQYHNGMLPPSIAQYRPVPPPIITHDAGFTPLQPRPGQAIAFDEHGHPIQFALQSASFQYGFSPNVPLASPHTPLPPTWTPITPQYPGGSFTQQSPMSATMHQSSHSAVPTPTQSSFILSPNADPAWQRPRYADGSQELPTPASSTQQDYKPFFSEAPAMTTPGSSTQQDYKPFFSEAPATTTPGSSSQSQDEDESRIPFRPTDEPPIWWDSSNMNLLPQSSGPNMPYSQPTSDTLPWTRPYTDMPLVQTICKLGFHSCLSLVP
jgi:hypothetical protein